MNAPAKAMGRRRILIIAVAVAAVVAVVVALVVWRIGVRSYPSEPVRITGEGRLHQDGDGPIRLCVGSASALMPPPEPCGQSVPITGVDWQQVPGVERYGAVTQASVTITGTWGDGVLAVDSVTVPTPLEDVIPEWPPLCDNPTGDRNADPYGSPDGVAMEALPGYQASWVTYPKEGPNAGRVVYHLAVTRDTAAAAEVARRGYPGLLCVGTLPGPPLTVLTAAAEHLGAEVTRLNEPGLVLYGISAGALIDGHVGLRVDTFVATAEKVARVKELVGPEVAPWVTVVGEFRIIG